MASYFLNGPFVDKVVSIGWDQFFEDDDDNDGDDIDNDNDGDDDDNNDDNDGYS